MQSCQHRIENVAVACHHVINLPKLSLYSLYQERWSVTFWVRKTPTTESTTDPFHRENRLSPVEYDLYW